MCYKCYFMTIYLFLVTVTILTYSFGQNMTFNKKVKNIPVRFFLQSRCDVTTRRCGSQIFEKFFSILPSFFLILCSLMKSNTLSKQIKIKGYFRYHELRG